MIATARYQISLYLLMESPGPVRIMVHGLKAVWRFRESTMDTCMVPRIYRSSPFQSAHPRRFEIGLRQCNNFA